MISHICSRKSELILLHSLMVAEIKNKSKFEMFFKFQIDLAGRERGREKERIFICEVLMKAEKVF